MEDAVLLSDIQMLNLSILMAMQSSIRKDLVLACYKYKLTAEQAPKVAELGPEKIQALVANLGQESLFIPRQDLLQLLEAPPALVGPLSAVRAQQPSSPAPNLSAAQKPLARRA